MEAALRGPVTDFRSSPTIASLAQRIRMSSLLRNSIFLMGTTLVTSLLGYIFWIAAAHTYSPHDVGLASALIAAMTLVASISNLGVGSAVVQILPRRQAGPNWSLTVNTAMATVALAGLFAGVVVIGVLPRILPELAGSGQLAIFALTFVTGVALWNLSTVLDAVFVAERAASNTLLRNTGFAVLKIVALALLSAVPALGALGIFSSWNLAAAIMLVIGMLVLVPRLGRGYALRSSGIRRHAREMLASLVWHHFINLGGVLPMYMLPMLVTMSLSPADNAYFYTAWMVGSLFFMVSSSVSSSLFAEGSHAAENLSRKVRTSALTIGALLAPAMLIFFLGGNLVLSLFGPAYAQHGLPLLIILIASAVPDAITNVAVSVLRVRQRLHLAALLNVGMGAITLALSAILLPKMGIVGAGWAWIAAETVGSLAVGVSVLCASSPIRGRAERLRSALRQFSARNLLGFGRYLSFRLRHRNLRVALFFVDRGAEFDVGPRAQLRVGRGLRIMRDFTGHFHGSTVIGENVFFNRGCYVSVYSELVIGDNCLFGERVSIHDENHIVGGELGPRAAQGFDAKPIVIGNNVWIGAKATVLPGVRIGDNAVIGANAVVSRDVPANAVAVGVPARVVRRLDSPKASAEIDAEMAVVATQAIRPE